MTIQVNLNNNVRVKLTYKGSELLRAYYTAYNQDFVVPNADNEGYTKFQFWNLIQIFGAHIYLGCDMPFETTILMEPD